MGRFNDNDWPVPNIPSPRAPIPSNLLKPSNSQISNRLGSPPTTTDRTNPTESILRIPSTQTTRTFDPFDAFPSDFTYQNSENPSDRHHSKTSKDFFNVKTMNKQPDNSNPRECGECTACCTTMSVTALNKPAGTPCSHLCDKGCSVYEARPSACHDWFCLWVRDNGHLLNETHRPDKLGILFTVTKPDALGRQILQAREVILGAADDTKAYQVIEYIKQFVPIEVIAFKEPSTDVTLLTIEGKRAS